MLSAEKKIKDIAIYDDQRNARNSVISGKDVLLQKSLQKRQERKARLIISGQSSSDEIDSDVFKQSSSTVSTRSSTAEYEPSEKAGPSSQNSFVTQSVPRNLINSSEITEVLDRCKISDNAATMLIASFVKACQEDVNDFCLSRSSSYRARIANRLQISSEIFHQISETPQDCLALHWDGKLTKDRCGNKHEEALFVIISDFKDGKLLGVQKLEKATGKAQAQASYELLEVKSNLHYTRRITPKRVTSCGAHLRGLAPRQHSSEETSQRWRIVGDTIKLATRIVGDTRHNYWRCGI